jgi:TolB-like protein/Tfp pilus assembly protein PilF
MGEVYRAHDTRLGRMVAVKTLPEQLAQDGQALARFEREARAVAALSHSNILAIHDFGTDGPTRYAVMELLEGQTLRDLLVEGRLAWTKVVEVGIAVADGLAAAHNKGVVHRDLKPANLFLTTEGQLKILDFGLARTGVQDSSEADTGHHGPDTGSEAGTGPYTPLHTDPGLLLGTVGYMSPEQVRGEAVDGRTDLFSLGCVLHEMLTGKRPFPGGTRSAILAATLRDNPPSFAESGSEVPAELERVVRRCLEKRPEDRFQSARDLALELRALRHDSGVSRSRVSAAAPPRRSFALLRWGLAALLLLALVVSGGFFSFMFLGGTRGDPPGAQGLETDSKGAAGAIEAVAVLPFENVNRDAKMDFLSNGLSESIIINLSSLRALKVRPFSSVAGYQGKKPDLRAVARDLKVQAVVMGRVRRQGDRLTVRVEMVDVRDDSLLWAEAYDRKAADMAVLEEEIARQVSDRLRVRLGPEDQKRLARRHTPAPEAFQLYLQGRQAFNTANSEEDTKKAIAFFERAIATDPNYPLAYTALAEAYYWLSNIHKAPIEVIPKGKEAARKALALDDTLGEAHALLGLFHAVYDWDWPRAKSAFERAVALNPNSATVHMYHALYLTCIERFDEAQGELTRARECDPSSFFIRVYTVYPLIMAGRSDQAISQIKLLIPADPKHYLPHAYLGLAYEQKKKYDEAVAAFQMALKLDPTNLEARAQLGHVYAVAGRKKEAQEVLAELMAVRDKRYVSPYNIAMIHLGLGDRDQAFVWLKRASEDHSEWFASLRVDVRLDPLRTDPRFAGLLRRAGFVP